MALEIECLWNAEGPSPFLHCEEKSDSSFLSDMASWISKKSTEVTAICLSEGRPQKRAVLKLVGQRFMSVCPSVSSLVLLLSLMNPATVLGFSVRGETDDKWTVTCS